MTPESWYGPLKAFALVVLALLLVALLYAGYVSITHWGDIAV